MTPSKKVTNLAIFASGSGSNAQRIIEYFKENLDINIQLILTNNPEAGVLERAENLGIPSHVFKREDFYQSENILNLLKAQKIDWVILAGFLWLVPSNLLETYPQKVINLHPALLPKFGGKGMYGMNVHRAVIEAKEQETGITIHYANEKFDEGKIIFQAKCQVEGNDTPETVAEKIHGLEYQHFPKVIAELLENQ
jgi:phosphoribosylglycinamide formyltransferase-1